MALAAIRLHSFATPFGQKGDIFVKPYVCVYSENYLPFFGVHPLNTNDICAPQDFPKPYEIHANHIVMICMHVAPDRAIVWHSKFGREARPTGTT